MFCKLQGILPIPHYSPVSAIVLLKKYLGQYAIWPLRQTSLGWPIGSEGRAGREDVMRQGLILITPNVIV